MRFISTFAASFERTKNLYQGYTKGIRLARNLYNKPQSLNLKLNYFMARFKPMELMSEVHGKFSGESEYYAAEKYGTQYTGKIGKIKVPPTQKQLDAQDLFATARKNVVALSEEEKAAYAAAFKKKPGKYKSLQGYMIAKEYEKIGE